MPSPELQSPASWMWKPCCWFGLRPRTSPATRTLSPACVNGTVAAVLLSLVCCTFATARGAVAFGRRHAPPRARTCRPQAAAGSEGCEERQGGEPHYFLPIAEWLRL